MKFIVTAVVAAMLVGCSTTKKENKVEAPEVTSIGNQRLSTSFKRQGVKIEWDCSWTAKVADSCKEATIKSIEVTAYATSNGNSENNREDAFRIAQMRAKAKLRHFIAEEVYSSNTVNTLSKNVEKANDRIKNRIRNSEEVALSDEDASKETNWAVRENSNDIARTVVEIIQTNAQGILRGVYVSNEQVVDKQTVSATIRWDKGSERAAIILRNAFGR